MPIEAFAELAGCAQERVGAGMWIGKRAMADRQVGGAQSLVLTHIVDSPEQRLLQALLDDLGSLQVGARQYKVEGMAMKKDVIGPANQRADILQKEFAAPPHVLIHRERPARWFIEQVNRHQGKLHAASRVQVLDRPGDL